MADLIMLRLEGLFQSWGELAKWDYRNSASMPTKSAVVGMIAAAMGLERGSPEIAALCEQMRLGIRSERASNLLTDYHTVQGMPHILNAAGKKRGDTIVSQRQYLQEASFLVVIDVSDEWRKKIADAFADPKWTVYLGRKNCVPTRPLWDGIHSEYDNISDALNRYPLSVKEPAELLYEVETMMEDAANYTRPDVVADGRVFSKRSVWRWASREE